MPNVSLASDRAAWGLARLVCAAVPNVDDFRRARHDVGINQGQTGADDVLKGCEATQSPEEGGGRKGKGRKPLGGAPLALARAVCFPTLFDFIHQSCSLPIEGQSSSYWLSDAKFSSVERDEMAVLAVRPSGIECSERALTPCHFPDWRARGRGGRANRAIRGKWRAHARGACAGARQAEGGREDGRDTIKISALFVPLPSSLSLSFASSIYPSLSPALDTRAHAVRVQQ